ncbi:MAG: hypothetical protein IKJ65_12975 [Clostridia bacterium]|nr:hypothetical protein [Clostridia bacterium]
MIRITNVKISLDEALRPLAPVAARALGVKESEILSVKLLKKSVDARDKSDVHFVCAIEADVKKMPKKLPKNAVLSDKEAVWQVSKDENIPAERPVVVGLGPCGLFAALTLAKRGLRPIVLERGQDVDRRKMAVETFFAGGEFSKDSNIQFGEGGAGAFSDGKLNTGIKDVRCRYVLNELYKFGAPEEILYEAKPHIGTDRLPGVVKNIRLEIERLGGDVRFETKLTEIIVNDGRVKEVKTVNSAGERKTIATCGVILAVGHSARDTFEMLLSIGAPMERKPFSIGARIEHSQKWLNRAQYGSADAHPALGAADYKLNTHLSSGRGAYTFCMCPGGYVVASSSEEGGVVSNGMSPYARDGENCNSALLVDVRTDDFPEEDGVLAGVKFQREWEEKAFLLGGSSYRAPAQLSGDFLSGRPSTGPKSVLPTYRPGVTWTNLEKCLPEFAVSGMREAICAFDKKIKGFAHPDAVLTGVETRSSSPIRVLRNPENMQSDIVGLYPAGEGAGYAGGILSAAVDGIRVAERFLKEEK